MSALLDQIEFYFCDLNIIQDKFLKGIIDVSNGYVSIDTLLGFVKVKELTNNKEDIVAVIEKSSVLELSEDKESIKRKSPIPTEEEINKRSVFIKGFPKEATRKEILEVLNTYGQVESIRMNFGRNHDGTFFNGTAFVEFISESEKDKFASSNPSYKENPLSMKTREEKLIHKKKSKKVSPRVELKLVVASKVCNRDLKNIIKNDDLLKNNVMKYYVERFDNQPKEENEKKENVETPEQEPKDETKNDVHIKTKNAFLAIRVNEKSDDVKKLLGSLKFYGSDVVVSECTQEESEKFRSFAVPEKSKHKSFGKKGKRD